jgi:hypothetical protein
MAEAELTADLFVALIGGVQTNKSVEQFYKKYEDEPGELESIEEQYDEIMSYIGEIYPPEQIRNTNWARIHLFYTLFTSIGHILFGLKNIDENLRAPIAKISIGKIRVRLDEISARYDQLAENPESPDSPTDLKNFVDLSRRRTTDTAARKGRTEFVCKQLISALT